MLFDTYSNRVEAQTGVCAK